MAVKYFMMENVRMRVWYSKGGQMRCDGMKITFVHLRVAFILKREKGNGGQPQMSNTSFRFRFRLYPSLVKFELLMWDGFKFSTSTMVHTSEYLQVPRTSQRKHESRNPFHEKDSVRYGCIPETSNEHFLLSSSSRLRLRWVHKIEQSGPFYPRRFMNGSVRWWLEGSHQFRDITDSCITYLEDTVVGWKQDFKKKYYILRHSSH